MQPKKRYYYLWAAIAVLALLDAWGLNIGLWADYRLGDVLQRQYAQQRPASADVVLVDIDQASLQAMNAEAGSWPWPRSVHAEIISYIVAQKPQAIVFDILFNEADIFRPEHDAALRDAVANASNVYFPYTTLDLGQGDLLKDLPSALGLQQEDPLANDTRAALLLPRVIQPEKWQGGTINFLSDTDGIARRYTTNTRIDGWSIPSMPTRLARDFAWPPHNPHAIRLNWHTGRIHIPYYALYAAANQQHAVRAADEFKDKIVIIGTAAPGLHDLRPTTMGQTYPGVEILATAIDNLKHGDALYDAPRILGAVLVLLIGGVMARSFASGQHTLRVALGLLSTTLLLLAGMWAGLRQGVFLPLAFCLVWLWVYFWLAALLAYIAEKNQREQAVTLFSRFLDPRVVKQLIDSGEMDLNKPAEAREVTILFTDIRNFTTLSEAHEPAYIVSLLNQYFTQQVDIVLKHGGTLDKFIGDAIMAFWGAPVNDPAHARHAVAAALEMSQALEQFKRTLPELNTSFEVGYGIHTGTAVVGFMGSQRRLDYTAIGDTVNLASRIEGLTKDRAKILVSDATRAACAQYFDFTGQGSHAVKGRQQEVLLFEPHTKRG